MTKIFNYPWHVAHQRELALLPNTEWFWLQQPRRQYSTFPRGDFFTEQGMKWVAEYEEGKYDMALLHLDQQCFEPNIWERGKGSLYRMVNNVIKDIPKVVLMHGTPFYPEMFPSDITEDNYKDEGRSIDQVGMSSTLIDLFNKATQEAKVLIFNSHTAQKQWGKTDDPRAVTIWHGMDKDEFVSLPKEPRVVTMISPGGLDAYYDRTLLQAVKDVLFENDIDLCHITVDAKFKSFEEYRNFLGRSLVYFNPTRQSPMPRARTEAMLSGCCVVTMGGQDVEKVITSGENGVIITKRSPQVIAKVIETMILDYRNAERIGREGRKRALELFDIERFRKEWQEKVIDKALSA